MYSVSKLQQEVDSEKEVFWICVWLLCVGSYKTRRGRKVLWTVPQRCIEQQICFPAIFDSVKGRCGSCVLLKCIEWVYLPVPSEISEFFFPFFNFRLFFFTCSFKKSFFAFLRLLFANFVFKLFHFSLYFWNFVLVCWFVLVMNIYVNISNYACFVSHHWHSLFSYLFKE